jgi:toxin ParE1/3/4
MPEYRVSKTAATDLLEIGLYTQNKWGMIKRNNYLDALQNRFTELAEDPLSTLAIQRDDIKKGILFSLINKHIIVFRRYSYGIRVVRVIHQSMDVVQHV